MAFVPKEWKDRLVEFSGRRKLTNVATGEEIIVDVARNEGAVSQEGDAVNAANFNDLEHRVKDGFDEINADLTDKCRLGDKVDSSWTGTTNKIIEKNGIVTISLGVKAKSALNTYTTFATIPSEFAPKNNTVWTVMRHGDYFGLGGIDTSGNIQMYTNGGSSVVATELISFTITYNKNI